MTDARTLIHLDGAVDQLEGAGLWGASMALHEGAELESGNVRDTNLTGYTPLRMRDMPEFEIEFTETSEAPVGLGERATTIVGPAMANAILSAVDVRLRHLSIRLEAVLRALHA